jgi:BirA family transcriptional regulator, biotin operon repressor / biotin---[acetyl-CoA-carboxylase] ligase
LTGATGDRLLALLRAAGGRPLSGPDLAAALGVSRAAVWKQIERLVEAGYRIDRQRVHGYRLEDVPDRLYAAEIESRLETRRIGRSLRCFETIDSTNSFAMELGRAGEPEGTVVLAEEQTRGRGRLGRSFFSPKGRSLYASMLLRPGIPPSAAPQLTLVAGLAVAETVERHSGLRPGLKWPNDVWLAGRKVAGILTEMEAESDRVLFVVCGPGVNLNVPEDAFPEEIRGIATSILAATGRRVDRPAFAADLFLAFERAYDAFLRDGFAALRERWDAYAMLTGREVRVEGSGAASEGVVVGIDEDGALRLRTARGVEARVISGDVTLRR